MNYEYMYESDMTDTLPDDHAGTNKPRLLLMGLRKAGKSSIQRVVFDKLQPGETLYLESTNIIQKEDITRSFMDFQIWDFPGQEDHAEGDVKDLEEIFRNTSGALIFVIDAQDDYREAITRLLEIVTFANRVNTKMSFEVLIHKVDGLSDDYKIDTQRDIQQRVNDGLSDQQLEHVPLAYYLTSIYDHSIYEALSKIIQKLIRVLPTLENLLNALCANSGIDKAYLFDTITKIYVATDSSPVDVQSHELCSDMIDVIISVESIYGKSKDDQNDVPADRPILGLPTPADRATDSAETSDHFTEASETLSQPSETLVPPSNKSEAYSLIKLSNGNVLYMREVTKLLVLICLLRQDNLEKQGLIDYNVQCFKDAVTKVFTYSQHHNQSDD